MKPTHKILFGLAATSAWLIAGSITIPNTFVANKTAKASEVNANFSAVKTAVDGNAGGIATNRTGIATNKTNITANATGITTNATNIATNTSDITTNTNAVARGGSEVTAPDGYNVIYAGGRAWLDRNVGATTAPTAWNDTTQASLGSLFQWGRAADGHQFRNGANDDNDADAAVADGAGGTNNCTDDTDAPGHTNFILGAKAAGGYNWRTEGEDCNVDAGSTHLWSAPGGFVNGVCPAGWRVPSEQDFAALDITSAEDAYNKIKLSAAGFRNLTGSITHAGLGGYYWTSTVDGDRSRGFFFSSSTTYLFPYYRAGGFSVRCVKHLNN